MVSPCNGSKKFAHNQSKKPIDRDSEFCCTIVSMKHLKLSLPIAAACLSVFLVASPAFAKAPNVHSGKPAFTLPPGRMRSCEARSASVQTRLTQLVAMASNMLDVFAGHATRVENFYTNTVLPTGKTVPNYTALVADIAAKKQAVIDAWTKAKTDAGSFSCTTGDPKQLLFQFRLDMQ